MSLYIWLLAIFSVVVVRAHQSFPPKWDEPVYVELRADIGTTLHGLYCMGVAMALSTKDSFLHAEVTRHVARAFRAYEIVLEGLCDDGHLNIKVRYHRDGYFALGTALPVPDDVDFMFGLDSRNNVFALGCGGSAYDQVPCEAVYRPIKATLPEINVMIKAVDHLVSGALEACLKVDEQQTCRDLLSHWTAHGMKHSGEVPNEFVDGMSIHAVDVYNKCQHAQDTICLNAAARLHVLYQHLRERSVPKKNEL
jgi:hypothetical protein